MRGTKVLLGNHLDRCETEVALQAGVPEAKEASIVRNS